MNDSEKLGQEVEVENAAGRRRDLETRMPVELVNDFGGHAQRSPVDRNARERDDSFDHDAEG